jgi:hypothetical protein
LGSVTSDMLYLVHIVMALATAGAAAASVSEGFGLPIRRWQLLVPGTLASLATIMLWSYPSFEDLRDPELWTFAIGAGVVGFCRGHFMEMDADHLRNRVRVRRGREGTAAAFALAILAALELAGLSGLIGLRYHPTLELGMALFGGYLFGRSCAAWRRFPHIPHADLIGQT